MALPAIVTHAWLGSVAHGETIDAAQARALALMETPGATPDEVRAAVAASAELVLAFPDDQAPSS